MNVANDLIFHFMICCCFEYNNNKTRQSNNKQKIWEKQSIKNSEEK